MPISGFQMLLSTAMKAAPTWAGEHNLTEGDLSSLCPGCDRHIPLDQARIGFEFGRTLYRCPLDNTILVALYQEADRTSSWEVILDLKIRPGRGHDGPTQLPGARLPAPTTRACHHLRGE